MQLPFIGSSAHDIDLGTCPVLSPASGVARNDHSTGAGSRYRDYQCPRPTGNATNFQVHHQWDTLFAATSTAFGGTAEAPGTRAVAANSAIFTKEAANDNTLINLGQNLGGPVESDPTPSAVSWDTGGVTDERDSTGISSTIKFPLHRASRTPCSGFASQHRCNSLLVDDRSLLAHVPVESMTSIPDLTGLTVPPSSTQDPGRYDDTLGGGR
jgi:hypothetical protein